MTTVRMLAVAVVVCAAAGAGRADEKADKAKLLVGTWEATKADEGTLPVGATVEFTKDGKLKIAGTKDGEELKMEGTYKLEGDEIKITMSRNGEERSITITIKKLSKTELALEGKDGKTLGLTRKK